MKAKTVTAISENKNLQIMLINLEKIAHDQKLAVFGAIRLFIVAAVPLVIIDVINKISPDIPASVSNIADLDKYKSWVL